MKKAIFIFAILVLLAGCTDAGKGDAQRVVISVSENGVVSLNGKEVNKEKLRERLKEQVESAPKERYKDSAKEYPVLQVLIETEYNVRWENVVEMLDECSKVNLWQTYFSNPRVNGGKEVELWLPVLSDRFYAAIDNSPMNKPACSLSEFRIKLLWVASYNANKLLSIREDPDGTRGMMVLKVGNKLFLQGKQPDWKKLTDLVEQLTKSWIPTKTFKTPPAIIDARLQVSFADVLRCVVICQKAGIQIITLAEPYRD